MKVLGRERCLIMFIGGCIIGKELRLMRETENIGVQAKKQEEVNLWPLFRTLALQAVSKKRQHPVVPRQTLTNAGTQKMDRRERVWPTT